MKNDWGRADHESGTTMYPHFSAESGGIYIDDVNTLDIKKNSLRKAYGLVLQDTWIFRGTVRENIAYAKPEATLEEVIEAAKLAHAHSFIKRLPDGYDTVISATSGLSQHRGHGRKRRPAERAQSPEQCGTSCAPHRSGAGPAFQ